MGKGDKKSRRGKITMGTYGVNRPRKRRLNYKFVARPKKESITDVMEPIAELSVTPAETTSKPKKKTAAKSTKEKAAKKKEE